MADEMIFDPRMREFAERLVAGTRNHAQVRTALDVQHVDPICDAAKQLAVAAQRRWVTPMDIKTAFRSIAHAKVHCIDDAPNEPAIGHVLDYTEVP
jgi:hypothetical protein